MKVASLSVALVRLQATHTAPSKRAPVSGAPVKSNPPLSADVAGQHGAGEVDVLQVGGVVERLPVAVEVGVGEHGAAGPDPG